MIGDLFDDGFVPIAEAAIRMGVSVEQVELMVMARVLRAYSNGYNVMVQPAIVSGYTGVRT